MSNQEFINTNRPAVEANVTRRLNFSRWFARGMLALGLASGSVAATGGYNNTSEFLSGLGVCATACLAAPLERRHARRSVENKISDYEKKAQTLCSDYAVNMLSVNDKGLQERKNIDHTISIGYDGGATIAVCLGWLGSFMATRALDGEALKKVTTGMEVLGGTFAAFGAAMLAVDYLSLKEDIQGSIRRLDNIDNIIRFED